MTSRSECAAEIDLDAIPPGLTEPDQWLVWRYEEVPGRDKPTKVPYQAADPTRWASASDPATWASLNAAAAAWLRGDADGIGFVFTADDPFAGIDLDDCFEDDGELHPAAAAIVARLDSYTERSPSDGLHVLIRAEVTGSRRSTTTTPWADEFAAYDRGRYFTFTGDHLPGTPTAIEPRQSELEAVLGEMFPVDARVRGHGSSNGGRPPTTAALELDDEELLSRAFAAKNGAKVEALYRGDGSAYSSASEADLALCSALAFWTGPDDARIDRLFRGSGLVRPKWEREDYAARTIAKALDGAEFYDPARHENARTRGNERGNERANDEPSQWSERRALDLAVELEPSPPDYLVDGWIERGTVTVESGDTGAAKSFCAQDLAVRVALKAPEWIGRKLTTRHGRVVVIDEENPQRLVRSRARALGLTAEAQGRIRYFHRLGVQLGAEGADWTEWLRHELEREPADLLVIDTGIAATAPEVNDNDGVAALYVRHLRPLAADSGVAVLLLLHERKPQEGVRTNRSQATMGARSWIAQADAQLTLRASTAGEERQLEDGYAYEKTFTLEVGKLRDGGGEVAESLRISSTLDANRTLLTAEIVNEGPIRSDDARCAELTEAVSALLADRQAWTKAKLAAELAVNGDDRTFARVLSEGVEAGVFARPKRGTYALGGVENA